MDLKELRSKLAGYEFGGRKTPPEGSRPFFKTESLFYTTYGLGLITDAQLDENFVNYVLPGRLRKSDVPVSWQNALSFEYVNGRSCLCRVNETFPLDTHLMDGFLDFGAAIGGRRQIFLRLGSKLGDGWMEDNMGHEGVRRVMAIKYGHLPHVANEMKIRRLGQKSWTVEVPGGSGVCVLSWNSKSRELSANDWERTLADRCKLGDER